MKIEVWAILGILILALTWSDSPLGAQDQFGPWQGLSPEAAREVVLRLDQAGSFPDNDFQALTRISRKKAGRNLNLVEARVYRRDRTGQMLILLEKPRMARGRGILRLEGQLWLFDPESREFARSSPKEVFMDSGVFNGDFQQSTLARDYQPTSSSVGRLGERDSDILELESRGRQAASARLRLWVDRQTGVLLQQEEYSPSGILMRRSLYSGYLKLQGHTIPTRQLFIDMLSDNPNTREIEVDQTLFELSDIRLDDLADSIFTKEYLLGRQ